MLNRYRTLIELVLGSKLPGGIIRPAHKFDFRFGSAIAEMI